MHFDVYHVVPPDTYEYTYFLFSHRWPSTDTYVHYLGMYVHM